MQIFKHRKEFCEYTGRFIFEFQQLELGTIQILLILNKEIEITEIIKMGLSKRRGEIMTIFKNSNSQFYKEWQVIDSRIGNINEIRKYIVHGIPYYKIQEKSQKSFIIVNGKPKYKRIKITTIKEAIDKIQHINTGDNGILGSFYSKVLKSTKNGKT